MRSYIYSLKNKVFNKNGASLMFALLFFVIAAALGSMVLSAATTASGRTKGVIKDEQDLSTVVSATTFFENRWRPGKITARYSSDGARMFDEQMAGIVGQEYFREHNFTGRRDALVEEMFDAIDSGNNPGPISKDFYVMVDDSHVELTSGIKDVKATATVYPDYMIIVVFAAINEDGTVQEGNVAFKFDPVVTDKTDTGEFVIAWNKPQLLIGGPFNE